MKLTISRKVVLAGLTAMIIPLLIVAVYSVTSLSTTVSAANQAKLSAEAIAIADLGDALFSSQMAFGNGLSRAPFVADAVEKKNQGSLTAEYKNNAASDFQSIIRGLGEQYEAIWIADKQGLIYVGSSQRSTTEYDNVNVYERPYFKALLSTQKPQLSDPVISKASGNPIVVIAVPVLDKNNQLASVMGISLSLEAINKVVAAKLSGKTGRAVLYTKEGMTIADSKTENILKRDISKEPGLEPLVAVIGRGEKTVVDYHVKGVKRLSATAPLKVNPWVAVMAIDSDEGFAVRDNMVFNLVIAAIVCAVVGAYFLYMISQAISKPIGFVVTALEDIAQGEGDLTKRLQATTKDELADMAKWFNAFMQKLANSMGLIAGTANSLSTSAEEMTSVARQVAVNAEETAAQANTVASAAEEVSTTFDGVASASEEMGATIREISQNSSNAATMSHNALQSVEQATAVVGQLGENSNEIGNVVKLIESIAEQTNLLALNATIEAARAGESGKGFAVVANEVKELAKQTAQATGGISAKIEAIQNCVGKVVESFQSYNQIVKDINAISSTIATAVEEQNATTTEIARQIAEAATGNATITANIHSVSDVASNTTQQVNQTVIVTQDVAKMAAELKNLVGQFRF